MAVPDPLQVPSVPALPPDATPVAIRNALVDQERVDFERDYREAIVEAGQSLDLTRVLDVLRAYHAIARLTQQQGVDAHRRMLERAATVLHTRTNPDGVGADEVRDLLRSRLGR